MPKVLFWQTDAISVSKAGAGRNARPRRFFQKGEICPIAALRARQRCSWRYRV
jgi:hypothetical protein